MYSLNKRLKLAFAFLASILLAFSYLVQSPKQISAQEEKLKIVTTFYPVYWVYPTSSWRSC